MVRQELSYREQSDQSRDYCLHCPHGCTENSAKKTEVLVGYKLRSLNLQQVQETERNNIA